MGGGASHFSFLRRQAMSAAEIWIDVLRASVAIELTLLGYRFCREGVRLLDSIRNDASISSTGEARRFLCPKAAMTQTGVARKLLGGTKEKLIANLMNCDSRATLLSVVSPVWRPSEF